MQNKFKTIISHLLLRIYSISRPVKLLHIISPKILLKLCKVWTWRDAAWMPHQSFRTAPVVEGCLTKVQVFLGVAHYRSKAKDKGLGILVPPGLTLTGHFSSKATGGANWGCPMCNTVLLSMLNSASPPSLPQLLIPNKLLNTKLTWESCFWRTQIVTDNTTGLAKKFIQVISCGKSQTFLSNQCSLPLKRWGKLKWGGLFVSNILELLLYSNAHYRWLMPSTSLIILCKIF